MSVFSIPIDLFKSLRDEFRRYQQSRKIGKQLFSGLSTEIETYDKLFEELLSISETRFFPSLLSIAYAPPISIMNDIVECVTDIQFIYSEIMQAFIRLAEGCRQVSLNTAFMKHLMETNYMMHDFVLRMGAIVHRDSVFIDDSFCRFFKLYENELFKKYKIGDVDKAVKEYEIYIKIAKTKVKPSIRRGLIRRKILRRFVESCRELDKTSRKIRIPKTTIVNLRYYVPSKFLPIVVLIEEAFPITEKNI